MAEFTITEERSDSKGRYIASAPGKPDAEMTFSIASACWVPPTYEVPIIPISAFDQGCSPIHAAVSTPSRPSSVNMCHTPSDA